jgi:4-hydroxyphenylpyruvate dioxygenase
MQVDNPTGTNGFDFLEFSTHQPNVLHNQFLAMGFTPAAKHHTLDITIYQQNDIRFILNLSENSLASQFAKLHGPSASAMGFRVQDAKKAYDYAIAKGARPCQQSIYNIPAICGVGGSLIYFVDYKNDKANYSNLFSSLPQHTNTSIGLTYLDHVTHNLYRGNMDIWYEFYQNIFNFREVRYFDIEGKLTGLKSRALQSPCGKIRIPLNESSDDKSQIEEFLKDFNGEGIQHIALGTDNIYDSVERLRTQGLQFLDTPETYYELIEKRLPQHGEQLVNLKKNRILIDGTTKNERKLLLQIFTQNMLGPVFFEIIQRKGDEGFGEGNFKALFESIELDQIKRGVLTA